MFLGKKSVMCLDWELIAKHGCFCFVFLYLGIKQDEKIILISQLSAGLPLAWVFAS